MAPGDCKLHAIFYSQWHEVLGKSSVKHSRLPAIDRMSDLISLIPMPRHARVNAAITVDVSSRAAGKPVSPGVWADTVFDFRSARREPLRASCDSLYQDRHSTHPCFEEGYDG